MDLDIYKSNELESNFIENLKPKKSNIIIGSIYKHPLMDLNDFNTNDLNSLLDKVSKEQKSDFLLEDFDVSLRNYSNHNPTNEFLDSLASNSFVPYILQPTRLTSHSKTLIDNIFSNIISPEAISGNLTATISDHLPQFMIVPNVFSNPPSNKANIFERDWSNFDQENFILDYFSIDWDVALKLDEQNVNYSTESFLNKINSLLSNYVPLKKINKYKLKFRSKPWITTGLQKSISVKNKFLTNFIKKKDPAKKAELHLQYKNHRNLLSTLLKKSRENDYKKCFESNWNKAKIIWKGIKSIITLKDITSSVPRTISQGENLITNPYDIANIFNNSFSSFADTAKESIMSSRKHFSDYHNNQCNNSIFIKPTDREEVVNIISTLNRNKSSGPKRILYKILNLLKKEISKQLADLINLSFSSGVFPSFLKIPKVVLV